MGHEKLIIHKLSIGQTIAEIEKNIQSLRHAGERKYHHNQVRIWLLKAQHMKTKHLMTQL
jgi:hypothetical protein